MIELLVAIIILVGAPIAMLMVCDGLVSFAHAHQRLASLSCVSTLTCDTVVDDTVVQRQVVTLSDAGYQIDDIDHLVAQFTELNHQYRERGLPGARYSQMCELSQKIKSKVAMIRSTVRV